MSILKVIVKVRRLVTGVDSDLCIAPYARICDNVGGTQMVGDAMPEEQVTLVLEKEAGGIRAAFLEHERVVSFYFQSDSSEVRIGDIFFGRVSENRLSQVGWFIDLGNGRNGFLPSHKFSTDRALQVGEQVIVQVDKEERDGKVAELTGQIQMKGKGLIYLPLNSFVTASRRIPEENRDRLKNKISEWCAAGEGAIIRTRAEHCDLDELHLEFCQLREKWQSVIKSGKEAASPALIFRQFSFVSALLSENHFPTSCVVEANFPINEEQLPDGVKFLYQPGTRLFLKKNIEHDYKAALQSSVPLKSGGSLKIDYTETLTTIDVNSGSMTFQGDREAIVFQINSVAAKEIAKQLRLRQIGGMIVVDFLRMEDERDQDRLLRQLECDTKADPNAVHVYGFTRLGLVELTRKRQRSGLRDRVVRTAKENMEFH
ncbi:ribonuclease E/G [Sporolactobacillus sp. STCC-11]|uniref:ribonuclease E/G n=1 Tax=Sporolactobacillus caesalpiniae TaxID=3230362 RepID=UPI0033983CFB